MNLIILEPFELALAACLVLTLAGLSFGMGLGLGRPLVIAMVRATVQLMLVGLVLKALFHTVNPWLIAAVATVMLSVAGWEVYSRQQRRVVGPAGWFMGGASMFFSSFVIAVLALTVIIGPDPWYHPQYAIPVLGMLLGNTMNGVAVGMDRLVDALARDRLNVEGRLLVGMNWRQASADYRVGALRAGLTPALNGMAAAGLVSLPGMMTGQILAGSPPLEAVKYQLLILFLITAGAGFGTLVAVELVSRRLFDERGRLRLDRLSRGT
ncbi:MAG: ABC transporter permease [Gammaproteobacteria bacterium]